MKLVSYLLALYILTKPFYLWSSGLPQISDVILLIAFLITLFSIGKKSVLRTIKKNKYFFFFLFFVVIINVLYSIYYIDGGFLLHMVYYIFDALGIIVFTACFDWGNNSCDIFKNSFRLSLLVQVLIFVLGVGRFYDPIRYMGTFNDPNQFAYYILLSFSFIYLFSIKNNSISIWNMVYFVITLFLIFESGSTGILLGMSVFAISYLVAIVGKIIVNLKHYTVPLFMIGLASCLGICVFFALPNSGEYVAGISSMSIFERVNEKIDRAQGDGEVSLFQERGYDRMLYYPQYLLFGAGEGRYKRFEDAYHQQEFHATLPSILFCYGIIPFILILKWMYQKMKGARMDLLCVYFALLLESFTLINSRQVLFWSIFVLCPYLIVDHSTKNRSGVEDGKD